VSVTPGTGIKPPKSGGMAKTHRATKASQNSASGTSQKFRREDMTEIEKPLASVGLHASFIALPFTDTNDGQTVMCYRSYFPAAMAAVY
jgi:hypothetical protein